MGDWYLAVFGEKAVLPVTHFTRRFIIILLTLSAECKAFIMVFFEVKLVLVGLSMESFSVRKE